MKNISCQKLNLINYNYITMNKNIMLLFNAGRKKYLYNI